MQRFIARAPLRIARAVGDGSRPRQEQRFKYIAASHKKHLRFPHDVSHSTLRLSRILWGDGGPLRLSRGRETGQVDTDRPVQVLRGLKRGYCGWDPFFQWGGRAVIIFDIININKESKSAQQRAPFPFLDERPRIQGAPARSLTGGII
ncbi:hypothetical protein NDU88_004207 [Pleurodeles waltl]|uniref:Uncharacterized protein n=1 Tax=Pleurodeles waltl TaxID=8319 RepID=A0AAV7T6T5_PLEWA|nr:hypothetical protein NDU88_004207 [Pleurodeles waltl]